MGAEPLTPATPAQRLALAFGAAFLVAGVLGFVPGVTTNLGELELAGDDSGAELLGLFQVSVLHNVVHLLFGVGVVASRRHASSLQDLLTAGVLYAVVLAYGLLVQGDGTEDFLPTNAADDWLHAALAAALVGAWALARRAAQPPP